MPITQKQLAKELGVAQATVSRALRNDRGVKDALRRRIIRTAEARGYSIEASNQEARLMRQRATGVTTRTNVICAIIDDSGDDAGFGGRVLRGLNDEGATIGSEIVMVSRARGVLPLLVLRQQVDGAIRLLGDLELAKGVNRPPVPWISILYDVPEVDLVSVDNFAGARDVGRHLCKQGHKRIAYIGPDTDLAQERLAGLRAAAAAAGAEVPDELVRIHRFAIDVQPTGRILDELVDDHNPLPFTALVGYNDYMADTALHYVRDRGIRVPEDLSIAGFDGVLPTNRSRRQSVITTAAIPLEELGAAAVRLLEWRLQTPDAPRRKIVMEAKLVKGETSGPAASVD